MLKTAVDALPLQHFNADTLRYSKNDYVYR